MTLLGVDPSSQPDRIIPTTHPKVTFAYLKHMWQEKRDNNSDHKKEAYGKLQHFVRQSLQVFKSNISQHVGSGVSVLLSACLILITDQLVNKALSYIRSGYYYEVLVYLKSHKSKRIN